MDRGGTTGTGGVARGLRTVPTRGGGAGARGGPTATRPRYQSQGKFLGRRALLPGGRHPWDHGQHPLIGSIPIGSVESIREDSHPTLAPEGGAHIVARLHDNWLIEPVRDAIKSGSVDGMSFRFSRPLLYAAAPPDV